MLLNPSAMSSATSRSRLPSGLAVLSIVGARVSRHLRAERQRHGAFPIEVCSRFKGPVVAGFAEHGLCLFLSLLDKWTRERADLCADTKAQHLGRPQQLCGTLRPAGHRGAACEHLHPQHQARTVVDDEAGMQRFDQCRLGHGMLAEHQGAHSGTGQVHAEHEELVALSATRGSGKSDVAHPDEVAVEEGDEGFGLGRRDEGHVVAQASSERRGVSRSRASCRQVAREHLQGCLVRQDPNQQGVVLQAACDRGRLRDGLQARRMVPLDDREGDLDEQRSASDGVVVAMTGEEGIDPVGALSSPLGFASTARDRPPSSDRGPRHPGRPGSAAMRRGCCLLRDPARQATRAWMRRLAWPYRIRRTGRGPSRRRGVRLWRLPPRPLRRSRSSANSRMVSCSR